MSEPRWIPGDPWCICDTCGKQIRMSQSKKTWDGLRVCPEDWEPKHPQLAVRGIRDRQAVSDARPRPEMTFIRFGVNPVTLRQDPDLPIFTPDMWTGWFGESGWFKPPGHFKKGEEVIE